MDSVLALRQPDSAPVWAKPTVMTSEAASAEPPSAVEDSSVVVPLSVVQPARAKAATPAKAMVVRKRFFMP
ncbi:hypothetical protein GCM10025876_29730 [Demequina litorisediminis]|uniref:Uncharacterized protein n=1 Tax=Demequina litorisediminis TaxID=1849022 RepID=A0ABQ6IG92_9MICO|nr:hypothetical protein GCM10025876_29730 [Demequina litorisediminis]